MDGMYAAEDNSFYIFFEKRLFANKITCINCQ